MPAATLAFSITAHERIDVLRGQVLNILHFCAAPTIILHVSAAFRAALDADAVALSIFRRIATLPGVVVNPVHLPTKWAHMFHAHVANIRHLEKFGAPYSHLVLCSSGDLFFRHGVEAHVAAFDVGIDNYGGATRDSLGTGFWGRPVGEDDVFWRMLAACGSNRAHKSLHEGTFYRRDLLLRALAVIDAHVTDWDYDDRYPKEEFFLPSLLRAIAPEARLAPRLSHLLGLGNTWSLDRLAVRHALRVLGAGGTQPAPLAGWLTDAELDAQASPPDLQSRFMLARLVRSKTDPLRQLMTCLPETLPAAERAELCDRVDGFDLLALDLPGRIVGASELQVLSAAASQPLGARPAEPLLSGLDRMRPATTREIAPCPATFLQPELVWPGMEAETEISRLQSCATRVPVAGVSLTMAVADGALSLAIEAPDAAAAPQPGQRPPEVFVFWPAPALDPQRHRALRLRITGDAPMLGHSSLWIEYHAGGAKRILGIGSPMAASLPGREGERLWLLNRAALRQAMDEIGPGQFQIYLAVRPVTGSIAIREAMALH